jgi:hypothetical protein
VGTVAFGPDADPETVVDDLVSAGVLGETDDGAVFLTDAFEAAKGVYDDSYDAGSARVRETVADLFGVDPEGERARAVSADELAALLALRSFLDDPPPVETLAVAAGVVAGVGPSSPVPDALREVDDDSWRDVGGGGDAVVTVWKRNCEPCEAMKADLDAVLDELRAVADVPVAGLDGEACPEFCRAAGVNAAPAVVCLRDGDPVEAVTGRRSPDALAELFADVYA